MPYLAQVKSFGVGGHVKLPGPTARDPNVYDFGTPYQTILEDLRMKDVELYTRNGLLTMVSTAMRCQKNSLRLFVTTFVASLHVIILVAQCKLCLCVLITHIPSIGCMPMVVLPLDIANAAHDMVASSGVSSWRLHNLCLKHGNPSHVFRLSAMLV